MRKDVLVLGKQDISHPQAVNLAFSQAVNLNFLYMPISFKKFNLKPVVINDSILICTVSLTEW